MTVGDQTGFDLGQLRPPGVASKTRSPKNAMVIYVDGGRAASCQNSPSVAYMQRVLSLCT